MPPFPVVVFLSIPQMAMGYKTVCGTNLHKAERTAELPAFSYNSGFGGGNYSCTKSDRRSRQFERAMEELENLLIYLENYKGFTGISHSSLLVNKIKIGQSNIAKSSEETLGHAYLRYLNNNEEVFASIKDTPRYLNIKERLSNL